MKKIKILILGGSSDIGVTLIKELLKKDQIEIYAHCSANESILKKFDNKRLKIIKSNFIKINDNNFKKKFKNVLKNKFSHFVNLTGYVGKSNFLDFKIEQQINTLKANVILPNFILSKIVKNMIRNNFGRIVNCSSIGTKFGGGSDTYNYSLSKFTSEFIPYNFKDWARKNVLINNLRIGVTNTKLHKTIRKNLKKRVKLIPIKRAAETDEIVKYILFFLSDDNTYSTGQTISISGGE